MSTFLVHDLTRAWRFSAALKFASSSIGCLLFWQNRKIRQINNYLFMNDIGSTVLDRTGQDGTGLGQVLEYSGFEILKILTPLERDKNHWFELWINFSAETQIGFHVKARLGKVRFGKVVFFSQDGRRHIGRVNRPPLKFVLFVTYYLNHCSAHFIKRNRMVPFVSKFHNFQSTEDSEILLKKG